MAAPHIGELLRLIGPYRCIRVIPEADLEFDLDSLSIDTFGKIDAIIVGRQGCADNANACCFELANDGVLIRYACPHRVDYINANYKNPACA